MNLKFASFICACLLLTLSASAGAPASFTIVPASNAAVYNVLYKSAEAGRVKISIINSSNQVVFTEVLNNVASFQRPYNFSALEQGEYTIALEDRNGKQVEKVKYFMNKVSSFIRVAQIPGTSARYLLNIASNGTETVTVKIYNSENVLLHVENVVTSGNYGVVFNLSQVKLSPSSTVFFEITTGSGKTETAMF
jgi:hypothetical protein